MKKYAVALDPDQVARMRDLARRTAVGEGRDVTWVSLLREAADQLLADAARDVADITAPAVPGVEPDLR